MSSPAERFRFSFDASVPSTDALAADTTAPPTVFRQTMSFSAQPVCAPSAIDSVPAGTKLDFDVVPPALSANAAAEKSAPCVPLGVNVNALSTAAGSVALTTVNFGLRAFWNVQVIWSPVFP